MRSNSLGDKAMFWGTVLSAIVVFVGLVAWLTRVDYTTSTTAQAQEKLRAEVAAQNGGVAAQLTQMNTRLSHIEGQMDEIKAAVKQ